jgi:hypothetical protein
LEGDPLKDLVSHYVTDALWIAHPLLQSIVVVAMVKRKLHRTFVFFFSYIIWQILVFSVLFPISRTNSYQLFFYTSWSTSAVSVALGFKVIHEIFVDIFRPYHTMKDMGSVLFKWAGLVMLLVAGVVAASNPVTESGPLVQAIITLQRSVRVIQVGLVMFLLVFSKYLGISWRQRSFGIALGFGSFAGIELAVVALRSGTYVGENMSNVINMVAYNSAIIIWAFYAAIKGAEREDATVLLKSQRWEQSLTDLQHPGTADSLIPLFEGMVDRAFSRTGQYTNGTASDEGLEEFATAKKSSAGELGLARANVVTLQRK